MRDFVRRATHLRSRRAAVLAVIAVLTASGCSTGTPGGGASGTSGRIDGCPSAGTVVDSSSRLRDALASAGPGDVLLLAPGTYEGRYEITTSGSAARPAVLCGGRDAVLDGGSTGSGYALHLEDASHWRIMGITVRGAAKGVVLDGSSDNELVGLTIEGTGEEGLHLRRASSRNLVERTRVSRTGLRHADIGEGIYVGSAQSNWCRVAGCGPDRSDDNRIVDNDVSETGAETVDVKEGTTGGLLRGNRLDGRGSGADSLVDLKGNDWTVEGTTGTAAPGDGVAIFRILAGWGEGNVVRGGRFEVPASAWAVQVFGAARSGGNVVECSTVAVVDGRETPGRVAPGGCTS